MSTRPVIDVRSDTVTRPTPAMRQAMFDAVVGDDQWGDDPTVQALEEQSARMLGKEAAAFMPSGIMGNLTSILAQAERGSEMILGDQAHIFYYEGAGAAAVGGVSPRTIRNAPDGTMDVDDIAAAIRTVGPGFPRTSLICLENTHNRCGGAVLPLSYLAEVRSLADRHRIPVHLDGARIFNAAVSLGVEVAEIAQYADTIQFCFSKGLAAPVGSMVVGDTATVDRVRMHRKVLGGAMRQSGVIAAAALVALDQMVERLADDHRRAKVLAEHIATLRGCEIDPATVESNIVIFSTSDDPEQFVSELARNGVLAAGMGGDRLRMCTHYEITDDDIAAVCAALTSVTRGVARHD